MFNKQFNSLILKSEPKSCVSEAYRMIKKNIEFLNPDAGKNIKTIMVTSAIPQKGMEKFIVNLALAVVESDKKVIVVDCDFDKPLIHKIFDSDNKQGLINLLVVDTKVSEVIRKVDKINSNFSYITTGPIPPNPSIFLGSEKMKKVIDDLKKLADMVFFYCRPVIGFIDSLELANQVDGVILFLNAGMVTVDAAKKAQTLLEKAKAKIIGVALNNIDIEQVDYFQYYHKNKYRKSC